MIWCLDQDYFVLARIDRKKLDEDITFCRMTQLGRPVGEPIHDKNYISGFVWIQPMRKYGCGSDEV